MVLWCLQDNLVKQLAKLVKVRYVEDITDSERVGMRSYCLGGIRTYGISHESEGKRDRGPGGWGAHTLQTDPC